MDKLITNLGVAAAAADVLPQLSRIRVYIVHELYFEDMTTVKCTRMCVCLL